MPNMGGMGGVPNMGGMGGVPNMGGKPNSTQRVNPQSVPTVKWFREVKFLAVPPLLTCKMENLYVSIQGSKVDDCVSKIICCKCASSTVTCGAGQNDITCWQGLEIYSSVTQLRMDSEILCKM